MFVDLLFGLSFAIVYAIDCVSDPCLLTDLDFRLQFWKLCVLKSIVKSYLHMALQVKCYTVFQITINITIINNYNLLAQVLCYSGFVYLVCVIFIKMYLKRCEQQAVLSGHFVFWPSMVHWADDAFPACPVSKACPLFCKKKKKATFSIMKCKNQSTRTRVECNLTPSIFPSWGPVSCALYSHPLAQPCK